MTLLQSLLTNIAFGFESLLKNIDAETDRATAAGEIKSLSSGDNSMINLHLHTGNPDCPARFELELEPEEWNRLTKKAVRKSISSCSSQSLTLEGLVDAMEARQRVWHSRGFPRMMHEPNNEVPDEKDWTCLRITGQVRCIISEMVA